MKKNILDTIKKAKQVLVILTIGIIAGYQLHDSYKITPLVIEKRQELEPIQDITVLKSKDSEIYGMASEGDVFANYKE